jgi:hypothetical protein
MEGKQNIEQKITNIDRSLPPSSILRNSKITVAPNHVQNVPFFNHKPKYVRQFFPVQYASNYIPHIPLISEAFPNARISDDSKPYLLTHIGVLNLLLIVILTYFF